MEVGALVGVIMEILIAINGALSRKHYDYRVTVCLKMIELSESIKMISDGFEKCTLKILCIDCLVCHQSNC
jgi:hypothetical protein